MTDKSSPAWFSTLLCGAARSLPFLFLGPLLLLMTACGGPPAAKPSFGLSNTAAGYHYRPPGPESDPWGPYIDEASERFSVPDQWIRAVMKQESAGYQYRYGRPIRSRAGAVGLMQLKRVTYNDMRKRYHLGPDPFDPHDNIMAGTAYIRILYRKFGSPGFLAAYNGGPQRMQDYLKGKRSLPGETRRYVAAIAPHLGSDKPEISHVSTAYAANRVRSRPSVARSRPVEVAQWTPPSHSSGGCTTVGNCPGLIRRASAVSSVRPASGGGAWGIQVGAFSSQRQASLATAKAMRLGGISSARNHIVQASSGGRSVYRARLVGLGSTEANMACSQLKSHGHPCVVVHPGT